MTTLTDTDKRILGALEEDSTTFSAIAEEFDALPELRERLTRLINVGLVVELEDDLFGLTASGQRVLATSREHTTADRTTLQSDVRQAVESADLRPDREAALRSAYLFLKYWGDATAAEITAAIYPEYPAQYESPADWWKNGIEERLASLPTVNSSNDCLWQCSASKADDYTDDGRHVSENYGSVRHAIEHLPNPEREIRSIRAAFTHVYCSRPSSARELQETVYPEHPAGYDSAEEWWNTCIEEAFQRFPYVEPSTIEANSEQEWDISNVTSDTIQSATSEEE